MVYLTLIYCHDVLSNLKYKMQAVQYYIETFFFTLGFKNNYRETQEKPFKGVFFFILYKRTYQLRQQV